MPFDEDTEVPPPSDTRPTGPLVLEKFIGQKAVVDQVKVALEASWNDATPFPHLLMAGPPGVGKTQLAKVIAAEMGGSLHEVLANTLQSAADLNAVLLRARDREVVFIDEADELPAQPFQTLLYRALEEGKLFLGGQKAGSIPLQNFTLLAATNHESSLVAPLRERFKIVLRFDYYEAADLTTIVSHRARSLGWSCEPAVFTKLAALGRGVPRRAIQLLESCRRVARSRGEDTITLDHCTKTCQLEGLCSVYGLDPTERTYLRLLHEAGGTPVRVGTLSARLGLPPRTLSQVVEAYLLRLGLVARRNDGRELTPLAQEYLQQTEAK
jgi:holliday junction DNA helicase RuvB